MKIEISIRKLTGFFLLSFLVICHYTASFAQFPQRPEPPRLVNDLAGLFTSDQVNELERVLVAFDDTTSTQIAIVTVASLEGYEISDFTDRLAENWGVGRKGKDNGILLLVKPKNEEGNGFVRISVGYGLEEFVTDAASGRIIENEMIPLFREGKYFEGVAKATGILMDLTSGKYKPDAYAKGKPASLIGLLFGAGMIILVIVLMSRRGGGMHMGNQTSLWTTLMLMNMLNSRGHSGKWGDFSSGSGWFGGGGSGGGFGGFGGGSFGGGGASGSW